MMKRRSILGALAAFPLFLRPAQPKVPPNGIHWGADPELWSGVNWGKPGELWVPEAENAWITVVSANEVTTINGHRFAFAWDLQPGDAIHARSRAGIHNAVFVERIRADRDGTTVHTYAWSFHKTPQYARTRNPRRPASWMDFSLQTGHETYPRGKEIV